MDMVYQNVANAFRELRSIGYFAEENFMCCQGCGTHAVPESHARRYVFYHAQDADNFYDRCDLYLAWCGDAAEIKEVLTNAGLIVEHDGTRDTRIKVVFTPDQDDDDEIGTPAGSA